MAPVPFPPIAWFLAGWTGSRTWGQVLVRREGGDFLLRHQDDRDLGVADLREVTAEALRALADRTAAGAFRPLRTAPDLVRGWVCRVADVGALAAALEQLYPGTLADGWAWQEGKGAATDLATVIDRQMGRGRSLRRLSPAALATTTGIVCSAEACVRHRRWTADGLPADDGTGKSGIPCLEPCPLWLKFAGTCARIEDSDSVGLELAADDLRTIVAALRWVQSNPPEEVQRGDVDAPLHPWRLASVIQRHADLWARVELTEAESNAYADT